MNTVQQEVWKWMRPPTNRVPRSAVICCKGQKQYRVNIYHFLFFLFLFLMSHFDHHIFISDSSLSYFISYITVLFILYSTLIYIYVILSLTLSLFSKKCDTTQIKRTKQDGRSIILGTWVPSPSSLVRPLPVGFNIYLSRPK